MGIPGWAQKLTLLRWLADVRGERSVPAQVADILRLRFGPGRLGASEYFKFGLFDRRLSMADKRRFAGWRKEGRLDRALNPASWLGVTTDKLNQYAIFQGLGIPVPAIFAVYHPGGRYFGEVPSVVGEDALARFLRDEMPYPFFSKPAHGSFGRGTYAVRAFDAASGCLELASGAWLPVAEFIAQCRPRPGVYPWESGYLFQELIEPHPELVGLCGPRLSSVRMIVLQGEEGPRLFRAIWKITTGDNVADNFEHGAKGNLLGTLDPESGEVERVIGGTGPGGREVTAHPDTGVPFAGFRVPEWQRFREVCLQAATAFPALRMQHWDIAIGARGPVVLEVNIGGDLDLPQLAAGEGVLGPELAAFVADLGRTYPGIPAGLDRI
jgi:hypothetical protein